MTFLIGSEPDGRIYFKGVAYFKNINDLDLDKGCDVRWTLSKKHKDTKARRKHEGF